MRSRQLLANLTKRVAGRHFLRKLAGTRAESSKETFTPATRRAARAPTAGLPACLSRNKRPARMAE